MSYIENGKKIAATNVLYGWYNAVSNFCNLVLALSTYTLCM